jgi:hypothetical protein
VGGQRVEVGLDTNGDGYLAPDEVTGADFLCREPVTVVGDLLVSSVVELQALSGVDIIDGSLTIEGRGVSPSASPVTQLGPLANLRSVTGGLTLRGGLDSLAGLENLRHVLSLSVTDNTDLVSLAGLGSLTGVFGLELRGNPRLADLSALSALTRVDQHLVIADCAVTSLDGLAALETVGGQLTIRGLPITSLGGLTQLTRVGWLIVESNPALTDLSGMTALTEVDNLSVKDNDRLTSLNGLPPVTSLGLLDIQGNRALRSLSELASLVEARYFLILGSMPRLLTLEGLDSLETVRDLIVGDLGIEDLGSLRRLTRVTGVVQIGGSRLTSLHGLEALSEASSLRVSDSPLLTSVAALARIRHLDQGLRLTDCPALVSLEGLGGLQTVGGLDLERLGIVSLADLAGLTQIGNGGLQLIQNPDLTKIDALTAQLASPGPLAIHSNPRLSQCAVQALVDRLESEGWTGQVVINENLACPAP